MLTNSKAYWHFRSSEAVEDLRFNDTLEKFFGAGISSIVRENIQNSLDAHIEGLNEPVKVIIRTGKMSSSDIPGLDNIKEHVNNLVGGSDHTRTIITNLQKSIEDNSGYYISFEDCNTKGLTGAAKGENGTKSDSWSSYAYKKGAHFEEANSSFESTRGGSHGIGKIASNSASKIHTMIFSNCDKDGNKHIGGTVELIEHEISGKCYRAVGSLTDTDCIGKYVPFENELNSGFSSIYEKNTRGLKIVIPYVKDEFYGNDDKIIRAVCDSFFLAILENNLIVDVNGLTLDKDNIIDVIGDESIYPVQNEVDMKANDLTPLFVRTYKTTQKTTIIIKDLTKSYAFYLYFKFNRNISKGKTAIVRQIGMTIEDKTISGHSKSPYNAVLVSANGETDKMLKTLENESHTKISADLIRDVYAKSNAKEFINNLNKEMAEIINDYIKKENPTDGLIDTSDVIYSAESSFRQILTDKAETVTIERTAKTPGRKLIKRKPKQEGTEPKPKVTKPKTPRVRHDEHDEIDPILLSTESVKRAFTGSKEYLKFDLTYDKNIKKYNTMDVTLKIVDGDGKVVNDLFETKENYDRVVDKIDGSIKSLDTNKIRKVTLDNGIASLELDTTSKFNGTLKFNYYVEVMKK